MHVCETPDGIVGNFTGALYPPPLDAAVGGAADRRTAGVTISPPGRPRADLRRSPASGPVELRHQPPGRLRASETAHNVVGRIPGSEPGEVILLCATTTARPRDRACTTTAAAWPACSRPRGRCATAARTGRMRAASRRRPRRSAYGAPPPTYTRTRARWTTSSAWSTWTGSPAPTPPSARSGRPTAALLELAVQTGSGPGLGARPGHARAQHVLRPRAVHRRRRAGLPDLASRLPLLPLARRRPRAGRRAGDRADRRACRRHWPTGSPPTRRRCRARGRRHEAGRLLRSARSASSAPTCARRSDDRCAGALSDAGRVERCGQHRRAARAGAPARARACVFDYVDGAAWDELTAERNEADLRRLALLPARADGRRRRSICRPTVLGQPVGGAAARRADRDDRDRAPRRRDRARPRRARRGRPVRPVLGRLANRRGGGRGEPRPAVVPALRLAATADTCASCSSGPAARAIWRWWSPSTCSAPAARERDRRNGFALPPRITARTLAQGLRAARVVGGLPPPPSHSCPRRRSQRARTGAAGAAEPHRDHQQPVRPRARAGATSAGCRSSGRARSCSRACCAPRTPGRRLAWASRGDRLQPRRPPARPRAVDDLARCPRSSTPSAPSSRSTWTAASAAASTSSRRWRSGARACLSGRALVYGLGRRRRGRGAARREILLVDELRLAMTLAGCGSVRELDRSWVTPTAERANGGAAWSIVIDPDPVSPLAGTATRSRRSRSPSGDVVELRPARWPAPADPRGRPLRRHHLRLRHDLLGCSGRCSWTGARPGDTLRVDILSLHPGRVGLVRHRARPRPAARGLPRPVRQDVRPAGRPRRPGLPAGRRFRWRPFLGTMGTQPDAPGQRAVVPAAQGRGQHRHPPPDRAAARCGCRSGARARCSRAGTPTASQGDGEVCLAALECDMRARLRFTVERRTIARAALSDGRARSPRWSTRAGTTARWASAPT